MSLKTLQLMFYNAVVFRAVANLRGEARSIADEKDCVDFFCRFGFTLCNWILSADSAIECRRRLCPCPIYMSLPPFHLQHRRLFS